MLEPVNKCVHGIPLGHAVACHACMEPIPSSRTFRPTTKARVLRLLQAMPVSSDRPVFLLNGLRVVSLGKGSQGFSYVFMVDGEKMPQGRAVDIVLAAKDRA